MSVRTTDSAEKAEKLASMFLTMIKNDTSVAVDSAKNVESLAAIFETIYDEAYAAGYNKAESILADR